MLNIKRKGLIFTSEVFNKVTYTKKPLSKYVYLEHLI